jgi:hydroxyacylglutathione hydrolase
MTASVVQLEVGQMANFTYVIADSKSKFVAIVDPSWDLYKIYEILQVNNWHVKMIINTHNHFDHVLGNDELATYTGAPVVQHEQSSLKSKHVSVADGEVINLGKVMIKVVHTPGHSKESICLQIDDKFILTGDTLFVEGCGRVDLEGGDANEMYESLYNKVSRLGETLVVYPGHNYGSSTWSTIAKEKKNNPALRLHSRQEFIEYITS